MQTEQFEVSNVKCGGCAEAIRSGLSAMPGVEAVEVDIATGRVTVTGEAVERSQLEAKLGEIGYPVKH